MCKCAVVANVSTIPIECAAAAACRAQQSPPPPPGPLINRHTHTFTQYLSRLLLKKGKQNATILLWVKYARAPLHLYDSLLFLGSSSNSRQEKKP